jgi:N-methylhydantoinase A
VEAFLGGEGHLDRARIEAPLRSLAALLKKEPAETAEGILAVADTAMERALRVISVERGFDPADFVLVAFGGAGALHVAELVERLGAVKALVPPDPGLLSAYGMLAAAPTREVSRTLLASSLTDDVEERLENAFRELHARAMEEMISEGNDPADLVTELWIDARYAGQSFELRVPREGWVAAFHEAHEERYGYSRGGTPVEAVTLRAVVEGEPLALAQPPLPGAEGPPPYQDGQAFHAGKEIPIRKYWRKDLRDGHDLEGPALILEYSSTTWLPPGWRLDVDRWGCLHLSKG